MFTGEPSARRGRAGIEIDFSVEITRVDGFATVPIHVELQDLEGRLIAVRELGRFALSAGESVSLSDALRVPGTVVPGTYALVGKIPLADRLVQFKKLIQVP